MIRVHHRVGRRTYVSAPLWLAVLGYVLWASVVFAVVVAVGLALVAVIALYVIVLGVEFLVLRMRRRHPQ